jgi:hypothetical protein
MLSRRTLLLAAAGAALAVATGCGPSAQLKAAREARYHGDRTEVFLEVTNVVAKTYPIDRTDAEIGALATQGRWYEKDGTYEDKALGSETTVRAEDGSVFLRFEVSVVGGQPPYQVVVAPSVDQIRSGYSAPYHMKPDDPQMPGWVIGKVEDLQIAIHAHLGKRFGGAPGTTAPAPVN